MSRAKVAWDTIGTDKAERYSVSPQMVVLAEAPQLGKKISTVWRQISNTCRKGSSESMESMMRCGTIQGSFTSAWEALALSNKDRLPTVRGKSMLLHLCRDFNYASISTV